VHALFVLSFLTNILGFSSLIMIRFRWRNFAGALVAAVCAVCSETLLYLAAIYAMHMAIVYAHNREMREMRAEADAVRDLLGPLPAAVPATAATNSEVPSTPPPSSPSASAAAAAAATTAAAWSSPPRPSHLVSSISPQVAAAAEGPQMMIEVVEGVPPLPLTASPSAASFPRPSRPGRVHPLASGRSEGATAAGGGAVTWEGEEAGTHVMTRSAYVARTCSRGGGGESPV
jgi:hypothetical protein